VTSVLPHLIPGQFVEHCKLSFLQRIQPTASLHFLRDIQAHSLVTLVRDPRLPCAAMCLEQIQRVSCIQLTMPPVQISSGAQHEAEDVGKS
jgi:hypothetical protein